MYASSNRRHGYDDRQYDLATAYPEYVQRNPNISYDVPWYPNAHLANPHLVFDDDRIVFEEERPIVAVDNIAVFDNNRVVHGEQHHVPVHKNNRHGSHGHGSTEPRKQVHFVEHEDRITESVDENGNRKVYEETVDTEADGFIQRKHKTFELNKFGTFKPYY